MPAQLQLSRHRNVYNAYVCVQVHQQTPSLLDTLGTATGLSKIDDS